MKQNKLETYTYLFQELDTLSDEIFYGKPITTKEFNFIGSRGSAKTYRCLETLIKAFLSPKNNIIYIVREQWSELDNLKEELIPKLEELGFPVRPGLNGNYNAKLNTISNGYNKIIFKALNAETMKVSKGKGAGLPVWKEADNILIFFEEANQINEQLLEITLQSLRGNSKTNIIKLFASNPWDPQNWYIKKCNSIIKENFEELDTKGYQKKIYYDEKQKSNTVVVRNNILTNPHLSDDFVLNLEKYRDTMYNFWLIAARGMAGVLGDMIYKNNLAKMKEFDINALNLNNGTFFQGGVDWGYGASSGASPSTAHFGAINLISGVDILDEKTIWNNQEEAYSTTDQVDMIIMFYRDKFLEYLAPFKVYIDNAEGSDFYMQFNNRLIKFGLDTSKIEFLPTPKYSIESRVLLVNLMLANGLLRIAPKCGELIKALNNCYYIEKRSNKEGFKRDRSHEHTHWINSGVEYLLGYEFENLKKQFSLIFEKN